jgi:CelD/BcsL family acetyltransferase involved in cellulose biosynthesis
VQEESPSITLADTAARVEVIGELPRLEALEEQWHALARDIPWPMAQFEWIISAAKTYQDDKFCVVIVQEAGVLQAVAPLVLRRYGLTHRLECLDYMLSEPQRLIARDERHLQLLFKALRGLRYPFILQGVTAECQDDQCFRTIPGSGLRMVAATGKDSFVPFDDPGGNLEERMSASRRGTLRRKRKAAEKQGPVRFTILRPRADELPALLDDFFRVESSGWKGRAATGLQYDVQRASFFRMYCDRMAREDALRLGFMTIGDTTAAVRIDVVWGNKSWELKIGYDERFAHCSPGLLLSHEALRHGQAEGLLGHHFLGEAEAWHETWAAETMNRVTLRYYPTSLPGMLTLLQDASSHVARVLETRLGPFSFRSRGLFGKSGVPHLSGAAGLVPWL